MSNEGTAIVTGTSSGIGKAIAQTLLGEGWRVVGFDIAPSGIAHAAFDAVRVDLSDGAAAEAAAAKAGGARALIHAAGAARYAPLGDLRPADSEAIWRVHVEAVVRVANIVIPAMAARRFGRVVLIGSRASQGIAGRSQYGAAKAALVGLARSWAAEVVTSGVTVNVVSPAATQTAMLDDPARKADPPQMPPIGRYIRPDEIAATVSFLLSPAAATITGQEIMICGGASLG